MKPPKGKVAGVRVTIKPLSKAEVEDARASPSAKAARAFRKSAFPGGKAKK
jgi:hypothetical protein